MLRRQPIFEATADALVSSGLQPDRAAQKKFLWSAAENVEFYAGKVVRRLGNGLIFDAGANTIRGLSQQQANDGTRWFWAASGGNIVRWFGPSVEAIGAFSWAQDQTSTQMPTFFDFVHLGNWTVVNSGAGAAKLHKPSVSYADLSADAPTDVLMFQKKLNFLLAIGHSDRGTRVSWSDADNIESWLPTVSNAAGGFYVDDFDTRIRASAPLGQAQALFAEDQMALMTFVNAPFYFGQRVVLDGIGAVGKRAVISDGRNCFGVGRNGVWWTDSNTMRYIDEGWLHDYLQDNVNWNQSGKIHAARNDENGCFEFYFPMGSSLVINEGWAFDTRTGGWTPVPPVPCMMERRLLSKPIVGLENGEVRLLANDPTVATPLTLRTKPMLMQLQGPEGYRDAHTDCRVDEIEFQLRAVSGVEFRLGSTRDPLVNPTWTAWKALAADKATYTISALASNPYFVLEFRSVVDNWTLDLQGFLLFGSVEGSKRLP